MVFYYPTFESIKSQQVIEKLILTRINMLFLYKEKCIINLGRYLMNVIDTFGI